MARKETVIPEKVIKSKVNVEVTCDCCGDSVDGYWHMSSNQNGCLFEYTSPIDLCEKHKYYFDYAILKEPYPFKYLNSRYGKPCSEEDKKYILNKVIEIYEDDY